MTFFVNSLFPKNRGIYAILKGTYSGQFVVFIKQTEQHYSFLTLPDKQELNVPVDAFQRGIKNNIIEFIEKLPKKIYFVVEQEYNKLNKDDGLRRTKENNKSHKRSTSRT
jgi:hypothetical protein